VWRRFTAQWPVVGKKRNKARSLFGYQKARSAASRRSCLRVVYFQNDSGLLSL
jgi:hypothetical protein